MSVFLLLSSMVFAVEFGPDSAKITNPYSSQFKVGFWKLTSGFGMEDGGKAEYLHVIDTDIASGFKIGDQTFNNVKCLKMNSVGSEGVVILWGAQDTEGNIWALKVYISKIDTTFWLGTDFLSWMIPAVPDVGIRSGLMLNENEDTYCEIVETDVSVTTNFGSYDNCFKSVCYHEGDYNNSEYNCLGVGTVRNVEDAQDPPSLWDLKECGTAVVKRAVIVPLGD
jgi:hypothetical protein